MPYEIPSAALARARSEFVRALDAAAPAYELGQLGLFSDGAEGHIAKEVERKLYEPKLPNAGDRDRKWIERLEKLAAMRDWSGSARAFHAAARFKTLLPKEFRNPGKYYTRQPLTLRMGKADFEWLKDLADIARSEKAWDRKWFAELLLGGLPEECSNFQIECLYLLKMPDGQIERRVRLVNILGEASGEINLDSKAFASPEKFRDWCLSKGNFAWSGNQTALQALHADICSEAAWKVINLVVTLGWMPLENPKMAVRSDDETALIDGVWFMGDCAIRNGEKTEQVDGCYWITQKDELGNVLPAEGFQISDGGRENDFFQKKPMLHPEKKIEDMKWETSFKLEPTDPKKKLTERELIAGYFRELCCRTKLICGESANLVIGAFASFAAAPEIFARYSFFPGVWLHGSLGSGKSKILEFLMEWYGFKIPEGIILRGTNSTATGLQQAADQYCNLPVWLNEYIFSEVNDDKHAVLHNSYNRGGQVKFSMSRIVRHMRTAFVVSGESTTTKTSLRSRFPHIQIAKSLREGTLEEQQQNFKWFLKHRKQFFIFGRFLLEHRAEFVPLVFKHLEQWFLNDDIDPRLKDSHGPAYASWIAMVEMLQPVMLADELKTFKTFMVTHTKSANLDVVSETNINVFWTDLLPAVKAGAIPAECFHLEYDPMEHPPGATNRTEGNNYTQGRWKSYRVYFEPDSLLAQLQIFLSKQRANVVLRRKDLRDQLSKEDYWLPGKLRKRFTKGTAGGVPCWGIDVDKHPLGYEAVTDVEYDAYILNPGAGDPRKGPLFDLVDWIIANQREDEADKQ